MKRYEITSKEWEQIQTFFRKRKTRQRIVKGPKR